MNQSDRVRLLTTCVVRAEAEMSTEHSCLGIGSIIYTDIRALSYKLSAIPYFHRKSGVLATSV